VHANKYLCIAILLKNELAQVLIRGRHEIIFFVGTILNPSALKSDKSLENMGRNIAVYEYQLFSLLF